MAPPVADTTGASCSRTHAAPDVTLSVRELASACLGGVSLAALALTGRIAELREGMPARASTAFGNDTAPWMPHAL